MRRLPGRLVQAAVPIRSLLHRSHLFLLVAVAATLMIADRTDMEAARTLRATIADGAAPILDALSRPIESVKDLLAEVDGLMNLRAENAELLRTVELQHHYRDENRRLEQENAALKGLLGLAREAPPTFVTGRVVADSGSPYVRTLLVNAGGRDGVSVNQAAMADRGLVGRVVDVGRRASRILLLTDSNSRIPVMLERTGARAVLAGDNGDLPRLVHFSADESMEPGDRVVTSGHGRVFPPGLPVGIVVEGPADGGRVRPAVDLGRVGYARLLAWTPPAFEPLPEPGGNEIAAASTLRFSMP